MSDPGGAIMRVSTLTMDKLRELQKWVNIPREDLEKDETHVLPQWRLLLGNTRSVYSEASQEDDAIALRDLVKYENFFKYLIN